MRNTRAAVSEKTAVDKQVFYFRDYLKKKVLLEKFKIFSKTFLIPAGSAVINRYNEIVDGRCKL